ncbi:sensor histidine kinase [Bosea sp. ANAM02]|uniref:histidine kinase dimerization/phosphoacceptor domain -containing protein n=1 Tax=Bosea sp. ANAM02 TaxID=2020412 RepID=UPI00140ED5E0|nr:sensor histidine kinase [Bosea sp. ANAM02]BCB17202.1 hypothetical protein OCUBac02_00960 [Bosea sp. ANAM02]
MRLRRFSTVRTRLLALLVAIAIPIACASAFAAYATYRAAIVAIEAVQSRAVDDFAVRTRVWYRGMSRVLLALGTVASEARLGAAGCADAGIKALKGSGGVRGFLLRNRDGQLCTGALDPGLTAELLDQVARQLAGRAPVGMWNGADLGRMRYDQVTAGGRRYLAVLASDLPGEGLLQQGLLLSDPTLLENVFDLGEDRQVLHIALVGREAGVVASRGDDRDLSWLPRTDLIPEKHARWEAPSRADKDSVFAARMVADPDFYIVASFDDRPAEAARLQFIVLLLAPLLTLGLLCLVCMRAIEKHCLRWLRGIEVAARSRTANNRVRATVAEGMPSDIRSVAEAFNGMVEEQEVRQRRLQTALDDNRFLVRELHHRVKNSLQVVQSYIGLSKRDHRDEARLALADAECRVHVLSAAYRFTLADGEMQPVRVDLFLDDVVTMISNLIRSRDQWVTSRIETAATLSVDRIIPLGFLVADVASRALRGTPGVRIVVEVLDVDASAIEVGLTVDRDIEHSAPPRLFAGLLTQIEAVQTQEPQGRSLGRWRIGHGS